MVIKNTSSMGVFTHLLVHTQPLLALVRQVDAEPCTPFIQSHLGPVVFVGEVEVIKKVLYAWLVKVYGKEESLDDVYF
jgi:hypothetical protein